MNYQIIREQSDGYILVTCLVLIFILTMLGLIATDSTQTELKTAANDRLSKTSFYRADSGINTGPKVIRKTLAADSSKTSEIVIEAMSFIDPSDGSDEDLVEFFRKIYGYNPNTTRINFDLGSGNTSVDIFRSSTGHLVGGSTEFASGYEGIGHGTTGGKKILYRLNSIGTAADNAKSNIEALYRFIPGTAGGL